EPSDLAALQSCRPANCALQLSAAAMKRFQTEINWRASDAAPRANRLYRQMLFEMLEAYRHQSITALPTYDDGSAPSAPAKEFQVLRTPGDTPVETPELTRFLADYPKRTYGEVEHLFYWNKGAFGLKPTTRLSQIAIYPVAKPGASVNNVHAVVATKQ